MRTISFTLLLFSWYCYFTTNNLKLKSPHIMYNILSLLKRLYRINEPITCFPAVLYTNQQLHLPTSTTRLTHTLYMYISIITSLGKLARRSKSIRPLQSLLKALYPSEPLLQDSQSYPIRRQINLQSSFAVSLCHMCASVVKFMLIIACVHIHIINTLHLPTYIKITWEMRKKIIK